MPSRGTGGKLARAPALGVERPEFVGACDLEVRTYFREESNFASWSLFKACLLGCNGRSVCVFFFFFFFFSLARARLYLGGYGTT